MTEQIVDLIEGVMPGPRGGVGPQGQPGLPGVNAVSNDEAIAACISSDSSATWQALASRAGQRIIMLGDSWTVYYGGLLPETLKQDLGAQWVKNYGVSGAQLTHMANDQITRALADPAARHPTAIVIVGGTNNIFNGTQGTQDIIDQTIDLCAKVRAAWPGVPVHLFPDMARTPNQGYNHMYSELITRATNYGVSVHVESMWLPMYRDFMFYRTDSDDFPLEVAMSRNDLCINGTGNSPLIFEVGPGMVTLHFDCSRIVWAHDIDPTVDAPTAGIRHASLRLCTIPARGADNTTYDSSKNTCHSLRHARSSPKRSHTRTASRYTKAASRSSQANTASPTCSFIWTRATPPRHGHHSNKSHSPPRIHWISAESDSTI